MRATWAVLGTLLVAGGVAYVKLRSQVPEAGARPPLARGTGSAMQGDKTAEPARAPDALIPAPDGRPTTPAQPAAVAAPSPHEEQARLLVGALGQALAAGDQAQVEQLEARLKAEAWDTIAARRHAVKSGFHLVRTAPAAGEARMRALDRARRLISRGVWLDELFDADGASTPDRERMLETLRGLNQQVMTWRPGLEGVTRAYVVPAGKAPVQIVSDEKLRLGHNAILLWNKRGQLDPRRLVAGETLMLPLGELTLEVSLARRRLIVWLDDVWVREFRVGVGTPETPTPAGTWHVVKKQENPPWYPPQGGIIPAGDARNELGSVWIHIANEEHPEGYGIHGTNKPETVGSECSQGCVRLANDQASEIFWWVRTASAGGQATKVVIR
jgi:hypothetical protein